MAILLVLCSHLLNLPQGWIGVDVFFVLSGYLITSILLKERQESHFWRRFYTRRVTRLVPAYLLLLILAGVLGHPAWRTLWPYLAFFGANVGSVRHPAEMEFAGFGVLWSLSVEEHFYLVWPSAVRKLSRRALYKGLLAILVAEPILRTAVTLSGAGWSVPYMLTPFRLDGLAIGSLLALTLSGKRPRIEVERCNRLLLPISLLALAASLPFLVNWKNVLFCDLAGYLVVSLASAALLAQLLLHPGSLAARMLSFRPLAFLGRISYGLYLVHELLSHTAIRIANHYGFTHNVRTASASLPFIVLLAWLSFRFYEAPLLAWGKRSLASLPGGAANEEERILRNQESAASGPAGRSR